MVRLVGEYRCQAKVFPFSFKEELIAWQIPINSLLLRAKQINNNQHAQTSPTPTNSLMMRGFDVAAPFFVPLYLYYATELCACPSPQVLTYTRPAPNLQHLHKELRHPCFISIDEYKIVHCIIQLSQNSHQSGNRKSLKA